jgi:hypothetical protein
LSATLTVVLAHTAEVGAVTIEQELGKVANGEKLELSPPYHRIERLCYLWFHRPEAAIRLQAFDLVTLLGAVFEKENDDWEEYAPGLQAPARQINTDFAFFIKKNVAKPLTPRELLSEEEDRNRALIYMSRRLPTNHQLLAIKLLNEAMELSVEAD